MANSTMLIGFLMYIRSFLKKKNYRSVYVMLMYEFHVLELEIEVNVYDPRSFLAPPEWGFEP